MQRGEGDELPCAFALLDDAADMEFMVTPSAPRRVRIGGVVLKVPVEIDADDVDRRVAGICVLGIHAAVAEVHVQIEPEARRDQRNAATKWRKAPAKDSALPFSAVQGNQSPLNSQPVRM